MNKERQKNTGERISLMEMHEYIFGDLAAVDQRCEACAVRIPSHAAIGS